jgi:hypothetical protein
MADVIATDEFRTWYTGLNDKDTEAVIYSVTLLEGRGIALGSPHASAIKNTAYPLRELRVQSGGKPIRIFYAFDPKRQAVLLIGGAKADDSFYDQYIPRAERIWVEYLKDPA